MRGFFRKVHHTSPALAITGWVHAALFVLMLCAAPFDSREITGANPWFKPMKFAASIALYTWTLAYLLQYIDIRQRAAVRWIARGVSAAMFAEIFCITMQAARGEPSHYNVATSFDAAVFAVMGIMILVNTLLAAAAALLFLWAGLELPAPFSLGITFGFVLFLVGSAVGFGMIINQAHTVGAPDGGPGLPFLRWSTRFGDLRVAHAAGLHALQLLPLAGWLIHKRLRRLDNIEQSALMVVVTIAYLGGVGLLVYRASEGRPFLSL
jgi:hypothetical protein